jgi:hypothetical protein
MDLYSAIGLYPSAKDAATGRDNRMRPVKVDDSHFQIPVRFQS